MLISHKRKFIFVHVPKTAGSSLTSALQPFCHQPQDEAINRSLSKIGINVNWFGPYLNAKYGRKHTTAQQMKIIFPNKVFEEYFKFGFVRNPWDTMVSYYHFLHSNQSSHRNKKVQALDGFKQYLEYEIKRNKYHQTQFLTDNNGELLVDYVGRFESLQDDFDKICKKVNVSASMPHSNKSKHKKYQEYYDEETRQMVAEHWKADIDMFGYTF